MKLLVFSIYDEKAAAFSQPFTTSAIGLASRQFADTVNDDQNNIGRHPEDFSLYHIGYFNTEDAVLDPTLPVNLIGRGTDYIQRPHLVEEKKRS